MTTHLSNSLLPQFHRVGANPLFPVCQANHAFRVKALEKLTPQDLERTITRSQYLGTWAGKHRKYTFQGNLVTENERKKYLWIEFSQQTANGSLSTHISGQLNNLKPVPSPPQPLTLARELTLKTSAFLKPKILNNRLGSHHKRLMQIMQWSLRLYADLGDQAEFIRFIIPGYFSERDLEIPKDKDLRNLDEGTLNRLVNLAHPFTQEKSLSFKLGHRLPGPTIHIYYSDTDQTLQITFIQGLSAQILSLSSFNELTQFVL